jgi:predicted nucleotidyltransferase
MAATGPDTARSPQTLDLSGWRRRDEARARAVRALLDRVAAARGELERLLLDEGVSDAWLFGSVARGTPRSDSDVDIAVAGCPPDRFYALAAALERALALPLDLVDLDRAPADLAAAIRAGGIRLLPRNADDDQR